MLKACVGELRHELAAARAAASAQEQRSSSEAALRLDAEAQNAELQCVAPQHLRTMHQRCLRNVCWSHARPLNGDSAHVDCMQAAE